MSDELTRVRARLSEMARVIADDGRMASTDAESDELAYLKIRLAILSVDDDPPWMPVMQQACVAGTIDYQQRMSHARWRLSGRRWSVALGRSLYGAALAHAARDLVAMAK